MGFLDLFKKGKNIQSNQPEIVEEPFNIKYGINKNGKLQVEFYDKNAAFKQFYDTTRLIIDDKAVTLAGEEVQNCKVSWYGENDCCELNKQTGEFESPKAGNYKEVLAQIDLELLKNDKNYCYAVMKGLLDQKRVERYLETGLQEVPEQPCGNYIGGVRKTERGYGKFFSTDVGKVSHNSDLMKNKRQRQREAAKKAREAAIANRKAEIERLEEEIKGL